MLAVAWPFGCPARFADSGGAQTRRAGPEMCRRAQTVRAFSPEPAALLGHATRPGDPSVGGRTNTRCLDKARWFVRASTHLVGRQVSVSMEEKGEPDVKKLLC